MAQIVPFRGYRYNLEKIAKLDDTISPPYDIISPKERRELYERSPFNIVRVELGEELPGDDATTNKYTRARGYLENWVKNGVLIQDTRESIYLHRMSYLLDDTRHSATGIFCLVKLRDFSEGEILPHEHTLSGPKLDRLALMQACRANISPILGLYSDPTMLLEGEVISKIAGQTPQTSGMKAADENGVLHELYIIQDEALIGQIREMLLPKQIFIADGHHRYETALVFRNEERSKASGSAGDTPAPYDYVMMTLANMDEGGLSILPTHRMVKEIEGLELDDFLGRVRASFDVEPLDPGELRQELRKRSAQARHAFGFHWGATQRTFILTLKSERFIDEALEDTACEAWRHLDVTILHVLIFERILGISPDDASRGMKIAYTRDESEAFQRTAAGEFQAAFILNPTRMEEIRDVALAGEKMPQKSTYFFPKLPTGLVIYRFHEAV